MTAWLNAALVVLSLLVLQTGIWATVLTVSFVGLSLCHPTVQTFLEVTVPSRLTSDQSTKRDEANIDALRGRLSDLAARKPVTVSDRNNADLESIPKEIRQELTAILALFKRDFLHSWYDPISFGAEKFPDQATDSLTHVIVQVSLRLEQFRRTNVATELSLTVLSVLVAAMRERRNNARVNMDQALSTPPPIAKGLGLWDDSQARIDSLRTSIWTLLLQSLPHEDRRSSALVTMLTEILTKQLWELLQSQSDPDVLNQYIVQYGRKSANTAIAAMALGDVPAQVEQAVQNSVSQTVATSPELASNVGSTLSSAVAVTAPAIAGAAQQTTGVLQEAYSTLAEAVGQEATGNTDASTDANRAQVQAPAATSDALHDKQPARNSDTKAEHLGSVPDKGTRAIPKHNSRKDTQIPTTLPSDRSNIESNQHDSRPNLREEPMINPWATHSHPQNKDRPSTETLQSESKEVEGVSQMPTGPHQGALVDTQLLDLSNDLDRKPEALPMDIPPHMQEPKLPPSLQHSKYDTNLAYEPHRSRSPKNLSISEVLASRDPDILDPFETFLQQIDGSHRAQDRTPEGMVLMQLHANLDALTRTADHHATTPELFEQDVRAILAQTLRHLPNDCPSTVRQKIQSTMDEIHVEPSSVSQIQYAVVSRLGQLWDAFHAQKSSKPLVSQPRSTDSTAQFAQTSARPSEKPLTGSFTEGITTISVVDVSANAERSGAVDLKSLQVLISVEDTMSNTGGYVLLRSYAQFEALDWELDRMYAQRPADTVLRGPPPRLPTIRGKSSPSACDALQQYLVMLLMPKDGQVAWFSTTQAVQRFIDKTRAEEESPRNRTPNLITSIGGVGRSFASGFVGAADSARKNLGQGIGQIGNVGPNAVNAPVRIGTGFSRNLFGSRENRTSSNASSPRTSFDERGGTDSVSEFPKPPIPAQTRSKQAAQRTDPRLKTARGEAKHREESVRQAENARPTSTASSSDVALSRTQSPELLSANKTLVNEHHSDRLSTRPDDHSGVPPLPPRSETSEPRRAAAEPITTSSNSTQDASQKQDFTAKPEAASPLSAAQEAEDLAPEDVDALLTAVFAVVHEAFNLQGSWTLRRGLLRVLEQVVRTTYSASVVSTLVYLASMLSVPALGSWLSALRISLWPDGRWRENSQPERSFEQKQATAAEARQVVLSYTPTQAAYAIGMGGKQTCMDALITIHDVVTDPVVSLDLHLALVLRVLDLAIGTASGDRAS
ncbi:hypothetical protein MYAM1_002860 [Malassezia yamatoensis]|uniref:PXA domain-containing protein n=1 Tax=Malassezia yamatoensis TaxID=253288 RepID=A0AAJ5YSX5_9BASI|nr:hypothetical protein MYAM1_002860 [Malassezia yamatoensis]